MSATIHISGHEAKIDDQLRWTVRRLSADVSTRSERVTLELLTRNYGQGWRPPFGVYEPHMANAAAQAAVEELGAELVSELLESQPERIY